MYNYLYYTASAVEGKKRDGGGVGGVAAAAAAVLSIFYVLIGRAPRQE